MYFSFCFLCSKQYNDMKKILNSQFFFFLGGGGGLRRINDRNFIIVVEGIVQTKMSISDQDEFVSSSGL